MKKTAFTAMQNGAFLQKKAGEICEMHCMGRPAPAVYSPKL